MTSLRAATSTSYILVLASTRSSTYYVSYYDIVHTLSTLCLRTLEILHILLAMKFLVLARVVTMSLTIPNAAQRNGQRKQALRGRDDIA